MYYFDLYKKTHTLLCALIFSISIILPTAHAEQTSIYEVNTEDNAENINSYQDIFSTIKNSINNFFYSHLTEEEMSAERIPTQTIFIPYQNMKTYDIPNYLKYKGNIDIYTYHASDKKQTDDSASNIFIGYFDPNGNDISDGKNVHIQLVTDNNQHTVHVLIQSIHGKESKIYHPTNSNNQICKISSHCPQKYINILYDNQNVTIRFKDIIVASIPFPNFTADKIIFVAANEAFRANIFHDNLSNLISESL